jgi:hypothetical protein
LNIERSYIRPKLLSLKQEKISSKLRELALSKRPINISYDMGHNHVRGAQGSTSAVVVEGKIVATKTNTEGSSAKREFVNLKAHLDEFENTGVDIASCTVDTGVDLRILSFFLTKKNY